LGKIHRMLFRLPEYMRAEAMFIGQAISALSRSRGGILSLIRSEPTSRVGTTQLTLESGETVEFETAEIKALMTLSWDDIASTNVDALVSTVDEAAGVHHDELSKWIFENLEKLTTATGNTVDGSGKPLFEAIYEMFEKVEMTFEDDGQVSPGFAFVVHPDMVPRLKQMEAEMTPEQKKRLDDLIDRKREEFFAGRRRRELS
jgi:hypothetical protein